MALSPLQNDSPRISVNDLALYMVSSDTARISIIKRAKFPQTAPIIRYKDARAAVTAHLLSPIRSNVPLNQARAILQDRQQTGASTFVRDDAAHSIEVINAVTGMANRLAEYDFQIAPTQQAKLNLAGVEVSVRADMLVHGLQRGTEQIGAAILRMTADNAISEAAIEKRRNMGLFVATLACLHVDENIQSNRTPVNRLCMSIDIQHGEVFLAPNANTRRINDLESACSFITSMWPTIQP